MKEPIPAAEVEWSCEFADKILAEGEIGPPLIGIVGQDRARDAIEFALRMPTDGYSLFVIGKEGTGRRTFIRQMLEQEAAKRPRPSDWCYIANFDNSRQPNAVQLAPGIGQKFRDQMIKFVKDVREALRAAFQSDDYRAQRQAIDEEFKDKQDQALQDVEQQANAKNLSLIRTPIGFTFAPMHNGQIVEPEVFQRLEQSVRDKIANDVKELETTLQKALRQAPGWAQEAREKVRKLNQRTASFAVDYLLELVRKSFADIPEIQSFLDDLHKDILSHVELIVAGPEGPQVDVQHDVIEEHPLFRRYLVNLIVDNKDETKAPIVFEDEPTHDHLIGQIEHRAEMGTLVTDFHLIRSGALHRANGGYLIIEARKILSNPMAWEALKRALFSRKIKIESLAQSLGLMATISLEPESIPLDVKIILVGDHYLYGLLNALDPEFRRLFKVAADFEDDMKLSQTACSEYTRLVLAIIKNDELPAFEPDALKRVLQYSAREAEDRTRFTLQLEKIDDLLREAAFCARRADAGRVGRAHVIEALGQQKRRLSRIPDRLRATITEGIISIQTSGAVVGQINGLSVSNVGTLSFGRPSRITARISLGKGKVVDIEREVELGGPIHSKGVLILSGFISALFGADRPLSLQASLVFEQSYGGVDGDSASIAEACALLSAIGDVPIEQKYAVTGAISQTGNAQAIGGVNEKIEGFFDVCTERGLTPGQGVIIPASNKQHLVLDERVMEAVHDGSFSIYAVETLSETIEILTGLPAGERGRDGSFPENSVFGKVERRLAEMEETRRKLLAKFEENIP